MSHRVSTHKNQNLKPNPTAHNSSKFVKQRKSSNFLNKVLVDSKDDLLNEEENLTDNEIN